MMRPTGQEIMAMKNIVCYLILQEEGQATT